MCIRDSNTPNNNNDHRGISAADTSQTLRNTSAYPARQSSDSRQLYTPAATDISWSTHSASHIQTVTKVSCLGCWRKLDQVEWFSLFSSLWRCSGCSWYKVWCAGVPDLWGERNLCETGFGWWGGKLVEPNCHFPLRFMWVRYHAWICLFMLACSYLLEGS